MKVVHALLYLLVGTALSLEARGEKRSCRQGEWTLGLKDLRPDGRHSESTGRSTNYCDLWGQGRSLSEFRALDESGATVFRGVSLLVEVGEEEKVLWAMVGEPGYTRLTGRQEEGVLVHRGTGVDGMGRFSERSRTVQDGPEGFVFSMDRRYEGMGGWLQDFNLIEGRRLKPVSPPLPEHLSVSHPSARPGGSWHHMGRVRVEEAFRPRHVIEDRRVILDGHAVVSERRWLDGEDRLLRQDYSFETLVNGRWRVLHWNPETNTVAVRAWGESEAEERQGDRRERITRSVQGDARRHRKLDGDGLLEEWWLHPIDPQPAPDVGSATGCGDYDHVLGEYRLDASSLKPDRSRRPGVGHVSGYRMLDGGMIGADMHVLFMDGGGFRGVTLRSRGDEGPWHVSWVAVGQATAPSGVARSDEAGCVELFQGRDEHGPWTGELRFEELDERGFEVRMDRSYPNGPTIPDVWTYSARRLP